MDTDFQELSGRRILVVEDDFLVAQVLVDLLEDAGAEVLGPIGWLEEAVSYIQDNAAKLDGAVLDVNLHGKKSYPIADALIARSVKFVFSTGYGSGVLDSRYDKYPRCQKPFSRAVLISTLLALQLR